MNFHPVIENYEADMIWNSEKNAFLRIYFVESKHGHKSYREVGTELLYFEANDPSLAPHWLGECYLMEEHFKDELIDAMATILLKNTKCSEPFLLRVNKGSRYHGKYRQFGKIDEGYDD